MVITSVALVMSKITALAVPYLYLDIPKVQAEKSNKGLFLEKRKGKILPLISVWLQ